MSGKCSKEEKTHKKLNLEGDIHLRVNTFLGDTEENRLQVGGTETDTPKLCPGPSRGSAGVPDQKYLSGSQSSTNALWECIPKGGPHEAQG